MKLARSKMQVQANGVCVAPLARGGEIYIGCDRCDPSQPELSGIARFDRLTGQPVWVAGEAMSNPSFGSAAIDAAGNVGLLAQTDSATKFIVAHSDGSGVHSDAIPAAAAAVLNMPLAAAGGFLFLEAGNLDAGPSSGDRIQVSAELLAQANALFFAGADQIGVSTGRPGIDTQTGGATMVARSGETIWSYAGEPLEESLAPLSANGELWVVAASGRLIAVEAPAVGPTLGAWPFPGHDGSNARTIER